MRKLSRITGFRDPQIKRFNEMYAEIFEDLAEGEEEDSNAVLKYAREELSEFKSYLACAEADENKRRKTMDLKRSVTDFSEEEIAHFDHMQDVLTEFNRIVGDDDIDVEQIIPPYSDIEMMEYSQYRELWIANECKDIHENGSVDQSFES